jgi:hypothetical protein
MNSQIRRDDVETVGKERNEAAKHVAAGRESMEQQQRWVTDAADHRQARLFEPPHAGSFQVVITSADIAALIGEIEAGIAKAEQECALDRTLALIAD